MQILRRPYTLNRLQTRQGNSWNLCKESRRLWYYCVHSNTTCHATLNSRNRREPQTSLFDQTKMQTWKTYYEEIPRRVPFKVLQAKVKLHVVTYDSLENPRKNKIIPRRYFTKAPNKRITRKANPGALVFFPWLKEGRPQWWPQAVAVAAAIRATKVS